MENKKIYILQDSAHLWGLMAWIGLRSLGFNCRLIKSTEITQGGILGKHDLLLAPGGSARHKANALGGTGLDHVRAWLMGGGHYLGFCGGAGLALTHGSLDDGLGICPWKRAPYDLRIQHLISGYVHASTFCGRLKIPIWWPGRFSPNPLHSQEILASYEAPADDLWLADLPYARIPHKFYENLADVIPPQFPCGEPLIIGGKYGAGDYILSYSHLETPDSPEANGLLARLLKEKWNLVAQKDLIKPWRTMDPLMQGRPWPPALREGRAKILNLLKLGVELGLFFQRTSWLTGWRPGLPGIAFNNLLAALASLEECAPNEASLDFWQKGGKNFLGSYDQFIAEAANYLWAARMSKTLSWQDDGRLEKKRAELFGNPMQGGGIVEGLLYFIEEMIYLAQGD